MANNRSTPTTKKTNPVRTNGRAGARVLTMLNGSTGSAAKPNPPKGPTQVRTGPKGQAPPLPTKKKK